MPVSSLERENERGADRRMAGERQFHGGREDAHAHRAAGSRLEHEHGLGKAEFSRDRLHPGVVQRIGVEHDGKRIAGEAPLSEHVESREG